MIKEKLLYRLIGQNLKKRRRNLGWTQFDLGRAVGLQRTSVANIEAGKQKPPLHVLYALCAQMNLDLRSVLPHIAEVTVRPTMVPDLIVGQDEATLEVISSSSTENTALDQLAGQDGAVPPKTAEVIRRYMKENKGR